MNVSLVLTKFERLTDLTSSSPTTLPLLKQAVDTFPFPKLNRQEEWRLVQIRSAIDQHLARLKVETP